MKEPSVIKKTLWQAMYLGAFCALDVTHNDMADDLVALTNTEDDVFDAIKAMAAAGKGNRVHAARDLLRTRAKR